MANRRDWGGGVDDSEESTHQMIERMWESITYIRTRLDQQLPGQPSGVAPLVTEEIMLEPLVPPYGVEAPLAAPLPPVVPVRPASVEKSTMIVERFLHLQPPTYSRGPSLDTAEHWIHEIERVFVTMRCPQANRRPISKAHAQILLSYNVKPNVKLKQPILVHWCPPSTHFCLNVDGASRGSSGPCGGGGSIRDERGNFRLGFAENNVILSTVLTDSTALVVSIQRKAPPSWSVLPWWHNMMKMIEDLNYQVSHIYREGNQVLDSLASHACLSRKNQVFLNVSDLPPFTRGAFVLDKVGLPNFRTGP
ncbi:hypothetical protein Taro_054094 [Colocasia esculenta]|uniref:RNase H type-1 domain-containing protein n=1 Tax=Colocasia esculenta TaxID=4460 RepID=A0A843XPG8_COLES|nr:hypothetical protein [Colocasia esculenta]